ncbi:hypothetical protein ACGFX4_40175 [Kitasatospora sp. NPDC048365]|uniref:hypothetical protein n=1 Tax=Kitasatospora sp. NPDC048365 TaxID=3364050 RepID=UPI003713941C
MPVLSGVRSTWIPALRELIAGLSGEQHPSGSGSAGLSPDGIPGGLTRHQLQRFVRAGLLSRDGSLFRPTPAALAWQRTNDHALLVELLHNNVRFVGELMESVAAGHQTLEQLLRVARDEFDLTWDTTGPVHNRTTWLVVTGMVDRFGGQFHLTDAGRQFLATLVLGRPEREDPASVVELPPAVGVIADLIDSLDEAALRNRVDGASLYVPGATANGGMLDALRMLTEAAIPSITDTGFAQLVQESFPKAQTASTGRTAKDSLKALGLLERTSSTTWSATAAGRVWVESGEPLDLARIVHSSVGFFGELLGELDTAGQSTSGALAELSRLYLPNREKPLTRTAITVRLNLLEACGLVTRPSHTLYRTTPMGRAFGRALPCQSADDMPPRLEPDVGTAHRPGGSSVDVPQPGAWLPVSAGETIAAEVVSAARDSADYKRLERAVVAALGYLGMPGRHVGGRGAADGTVRHGIGTDSQVLAIEAKTSATGPVAEQSLFRLPRHREDLGAAVTLLVGPGFQGTMLKEADDDTAIAVIETDLLAEVVRRQDRTPLTPAQLSGLVDPALPAARRRSALSIHWNAQEERSALEYALVEILNAEAEDPLEEGGWLDLTSLRRALRSRNHRTDEASVVEALGFLASTRIGVVQHSLRGYRSTAGLLTAGQRLQALGQQWTTAANSHHRSSEGHTARTESTS